jgi:hypothetical protein
MRKVFGLAVCFAALVFLFSGYTKFSTHAAAGDCSLVVPDNPLTAQGLATPYILQSPCHEGDVNTSAFVQAVIVNTDTGALSVYG